MSTLYDKEFIEEEEYSFDTTAFETLKYMTEYDSDNESSEEDDEDDEKNNIYDSENSAISKNIISEEDDKVITQINGKKNLLTPCVLVDVDDNGKLCCCGSTKDLWRLWQLVGMWEVDGKIVEIQKKQLENLGVCYKHFLYDQNQLHKGGIKQIISIENSTLHHHRCCFCGINKYFYSRGKCCKSHS
jgi:hypothetical protein